MDHPTSARVLVIFQDQEPGVRRVVEEAQKLAFPHGETVAVKTVEQALKVGASGRPEILVLQQPADVDVKSAMAAEDAMGLPRWAVVAMCADRDHGNAVETVAWSNGNPALTPALLAEAFRNAITRRALLRENIRFRNELMTIGTRVVHDLRSPLGGVLTSAEVVKEVLLSDSPANAALTDSIVESVDGQMKLIRQLSTFSKASGQSQVAEKFNMSGPFWSALQGVEKQARAKGVTIVQPREWPEVTGSQALTETIWQHLLSNALVHSGPAPKVTVGWDRANPDTRVRFWVQSNVAVPEKKREILFMPFHQLHRPNAPRGWGLAMVQRLVELQDGTCGYEAPAAGGSFFYFTLPAAGSA